MGREQTDFTEIPYLVENSEQLFELFKWMMKEEAGKQAVINFLIELGKQARKEQHVAVLELIDQLTKAFFVLGGDELSTFGHALLFSLALKNEGRLIEDEEKVV